MYVYIYIYVNITLHLKHIRLREGHAMSHGRGTHNELHIIRCV